MKKAIIVAVLAIVVIVMVANASAASRYCRSKYESAEEIQTARGIMFFSPMAPIAAIWWTVEKIAIAGCSASTSIPISKSSYTDTASTNPETPRIGFENPNSQ